MTRQINYAPIAETRAADAFLPARRVWERYGITSMSLWRWLRDPEMNFPAPIYFGRLRFFRLADLIEWERERARVSKRTTSSRQA